MDPTTPSARALPATLVALAAVLLVAGALLAPLLHGAFLLDDLPNLTGLERVHAEPDGGARFVAGGIAGPGGRPIALASFAVQAGDWPLHPGPFKRVNLALHLACALALFWLWSLLARRALPAREADLLALAVSALWLVHPLQLSSVAYVVQRMTLLAALPMLLGLVAFVKGRARVERAPEDPLGYLIALGGLGVGGLLALGSKESGGLILPLALAIDHTLFDAAPASATRWRAVRRWTLHLPLLLAALALVTLGAGWLADGYAAREFSLSERLLSQPRALLGYAALALVPLRDGLGVFHDDFAVSRTLLEPWTTLPALVVLALAVGAAVRWRRSQPLIAFGVAWFLANHLLESTLMPLELYFEHRNYLALAGLLTIPALGLLTLGRDGRHAPIAAAAGAFGLALVAWQGHAEARSWGDPLGQAQRWSREHPGSLRAQSYLANLHKVRGEPAAAARVYLEHDARFADGVSFTLDWLELGCADEALPLPSRALVVERGRRARFSYGPTAAIDRMLQRAERGRPCPRVALDDLGAATAALLANPAYQRESYLVHLLEARLARLRGDRREALAAMHRAFDGRPEPDYALVEASWWLEAGDLERAAEALERARQAVGPNPLRQDALAPRFAALAKALADARRDRDAADLKEGRIPKAD